MQPIRYALIASALLAAGAFYPHHNYNYFVLMKWVVFGTSTWAAFLEGEKKRTFAVTVFCAVALIHNPFMEFQFERKTWLVIDGVTAAWLALQVFNLGTKKDKS